jgi:siroheme synthase-like protein
MYPLHFNISGRLAVVVGGGPVGRRKADGLLAAGARVRLVCLEPRPTECGDPRLEWLQEEYQARHLDGASLVFAAASAEINRTVRDDARRLGLWVNLADDPNGSDFLVPATLRRGDFLIAISTGGAAPALAHEVRVLLEEQFDDAFGQWVELLAEVRPLILTQVVDEERRRELLSSLCRPEWLARIRREGVPAVRVAIHSWLKKVSGPAL